MYTNTHWACVEISEKKYRRVNQLAAAEINTMAENVQSAENSVVALFSTVS